MMIKIKTLASSVVLSLGLMACSTPESHHDDEYYLGAITSQQLLEQYDIFAQTKAENENPATASQIEAFAKQLDGKTLKVFFGTWCHDSQREIPRLLNLIEQVKQQHQDIAFDLEMIAVAPFEQRDKTIVEQFKVRYVPTIILLAQGKEIARITESTEVNLAADLTTMAQQ